MADREFTYIDDWSPVPGSLHREAQVKERDWWQHQDRNILQLTAKYHFYAGYYDWTRHRSLLNPFCIRPDSSSNFQIPNDAFAGKRVLDIGCGPISESISLVHCAEVHAIDPLMGFTNNFNHSDGNFTLQLLAQEQSSFLSKPGLLIMYTVEICSTILRMPTRSWRK